MNPCQTIRIDIPYVHTPSYYKMMRPTMPSTVDAYFRVIGERIKLLFQMFLRNRSKEYDSKEIEIQCGMSICERTSDVATFSISLLLPNEDEYLRRGEEYAIIFDVFIQHTILSKGGIRTLLKVENKKHVEFIFPSFFPDLSEEEKINLETLLQLRLCEQLFAGEKTAQWARSCMLSIEISDQELQPKLYLYTLVGSKLLSHNPFDGFDVTRKMVSNDFIDRLKSFLKFIFV